MAEARTVHPLGCALRVSFHHVELEPECEAEPARQRDDTDDASEGRSQGSFLRMLRELPLWPQNDTVVEEAVMAVAMKNPNAQMFLKRASFLCISERCACEMAVITTQPLRFWLGFLLNTACGSGILLLIYTFYWRTLGTPFLMVTPMLVAGVLCIVYLCAVAHFGPATLAWSFLGMVLVSGILGGGMFGILSSLFSPESQMLFGNRIARVVVAVVIAVNANNFTYISIPRVDGVTTSFAVAMGWNAFVRSLRVADCVSDLEISGTLFGQARKGICIWTNKTRRCDLYVAMGVGNLICGLLDFLMIAVVMFFGKFLRSDTRQYQMVNATIHVSSLGLELVIFVINVYYTFVISPLSDDSSTESRRAILIYYIVSLLLTVLSCYLNILGAKKVLQAVFAVASSAASSIRRRSSQILGGAQTLARKGSAGVASEGQNQLVNNSRAGSATLQATDPARAADAGSSPVKLAVFASPKVQPL